MTSPRRGRFARRATSLAAALGLAVTLVAGPPAHSADGPGSGTAAITGRLGADDGAPPALQPVELLRWAAEDEEPQWSVEGSSDVVDGVFEFARLVPGVYTMRYDAPAHSGFYPQFLGGSPDQPAPDDSAATFAVSAGERVTQDFRLSGYRELTIDLRFDDGGAVPSDGHLAVFRWSAETGAWVEHADRFVLDTGSDVVVGGLPVGRYVVHAEWEAPTDYPAQTAGGLPQLPGPDDDGVLVLAPGEPTSLRYEARFRRGGRVIAFVPAAGDAEVLVELLQGATRRTDSVAISGEVDLLVLPGSYDVVLRPGSQDSALAARTLPDVPVEAGAVTALGTIDLTSAEEPYAQILNVSIADHPRYGDVLEGVVAGVLPTHATLTYRWLRDGAVIAGATSSTYRVGLDDTLRELSVVVTARAPGFVEASAMATPLSIVPAVPTGLALTASAARQEFGTPTPIIMTATVEAPPGVPPTGEVEFFVDRVTFARELVVDGVARHVLSPQLATGEHSVTARFRSDDPVGRVLDSEAEPVDVMVVPGRLTPGVPVITGSPVVGAVLAVGVPAGVPAGGLVTYQWLRAGRAIAGATGASYVVAAADVGAVLAVRVTVAAPGFETVSVTSAAVGPVVGAPVVSVASSTALVRSKAKQQFGARGRDLVVLTAPVAVADGSVPVGRVVFRAGGKTLGSAPVSRGAAVLPIGRMQPVGRLRVTAEFVPASGDVVGSVSSVVGVRVVKAVAKVTGKLAAKRARAGKRALYRIRVKVAGVARPTGRVVIRDGKKKVRTVRLKAKDQGRVSVRLPRLAPGQHRIRAVYQGNANIKRNVSKRLQVRVR